MCVQIFNIYRCLIMFLFIFSLQNYVTSSLFGLNERKRVNICIYINIYMEKTEREREKKKKK